MTHFTVKFDGDPPAGTKVGDKLEINGIATVQAITAALVDISSIDQTEFALGETTIDLVANNLEVHDIRTE